MIYTKANVARTLGAIYSRVKKVVEFWKVCLVVVKGQRATFVSKKKLREMFVAFRKEGAKHVTIHQIAPCEFQAMSSQIDDVYDITVNNKGVRCSCKDWEHQYENFGKGVCKHGYAALNLLGFGSLAEYLAS